MKNIKDNLASKTLISSAVVLSSALFSSTAYAACTVDVDLGAQSITNILNLTQIDAGTFTSGTGNVTLNGNVAIASDKNLIMNGAGTFTSGTGNVTLSGNTTVAGAKTFTTGTGNTTLNGNTTVTGAKTFTTGTGDTTLNGNTTVTGDKTFTTGTGNTTLNGNTTVTGAKTFTTGTGNTTLNGNTTVTGDKTFTTGTGNVTFNSATQINNEALTLSADGDKGIYFQDPAKTAITHSRYRIQLINNGLHFQSFDGTNTLVKKNLVRIDKNGVGIGGLASGFPFYVHGSKNLNSGTNSTRFSEFNTNITRGPVTIGISIIATDWIVSAKGFSTSSDARIKNIADVSNAKTDLANLLNIEVTNYTLKDKLAPKRSHKKIIAQQIRPFVPQAVSVSEAYIPNGHL